MRRLNIIALILSTLWLSGCIQVPKTVEYDETISYTTIDGYQFHTETFGDRHLPPLIIVHGGPGGDFNYLKSLQVLSNRYRVIFYDQRGSGLSPRVAKSSLTMASSLSDLDSIVDHFSKGKKVRLIGHSWGGMLVTGFISTHPKKVSQAVIIEPGVLYPEVAPVYVDTMKESQSLFDLFALFGYIAHYPFVSQVDGHEGFDYVMTRVLNRGNTGEPYQCDGESMPPNSFVRGGYDAFDNMLKPMMDNPDLFTYDLTEGIQQYQGDLMLISSECSQFGYTYQEKYHLPKLPVQTTHIKAVKAGHNMITLSPKWSLEVIGDFFN